MADSSFESIATAIKEAFDLEFAPEGFVLIPDRLHESLGRTARAAGVSPDEERANIRTRIMAEHWLTLQFFDYWTDEIDPGTIINPFVITGYAERFKEMMRVLQLTTPGTGQVWYFDVDRIQFTNDPTGNKSRFVATIRAYGNNTNLIETVA